MIISVTSVGPICMICFLSFIPEKKFTNHIMFQSLEVVCRGSETQLQVTETFN